MYKINNYILMALISITILFGKDDLFQTAERLYNEKNYQEAIKNYQTVLKQSVNYEPAWFGLQNSYIKNGDIASANKLVRSDLSDRLKWGYIRSLFYANQFDTIPSLIFDLTRKYPKSEYINDALDLGIIIAEVKDDTLNLKKLTQAYYKYEMDDYDNGVKISKELISLSNMLAQNSYLLLSKLFCAKKEFNQAIATLNEYSIKFQGSRFFPKARYELGLIYMDAIKDTITAKDIFEDLISNFPSSPESYFARSHLSLMETGNKFK